MVTVARISTSPKEKAAKEKKKKKQKKRRSRRREEERMKRSKKSNRKYVSCSSDHTPTIYNIHALLRIDYADLSVILRSCIGQAPGGHQPEFESCSPRLYSSSITIHGRGPI